MTPEEYYRDYISGDPLRRSAEWERKYSEELFFHDDLPPIWLEIKSMERHLTKRQKEQILYEELAKIVNPTCEL